eukprot:943751-Amphidinium_carterae.1
MHAADEMFGMVSTVKLTLAPKPLRCRTLTHAGGCMTSFNVLRPCCSWNLWLLLQPWRIRHEQSMFQDGHSPEQLLPGIHLGEARWPKQVAAVQQCESSTSQSSLARGKWLGRPALAAVAAAAAEAAARWFAAFQ